MLLLTAGMPPASAAPATTAPVRLRRCRLSNVIAPLIAAARLHGRITNDARAGTEFGPISVQCVTARAARQRQRADLRMLRSSSTSSDGCDCDKCGTPGRQQ